MVELEKIKDISKRSLVLSPARQNLRKVIYNYMPGTLDLFKVVDQMSKRQNDVAPNYSLEI